MPAAADRIVETTDNRLFAVRAAGDTMSQAWLGIPVRRAAGGAFVPRAGAREQIVRRAGARIVREG